MKIDEIKDKQFYDPKFCPWKADKEFLEYLTTTRNSLIANPIKFYNLYILALQSLTLCTGHWYECGVYKGGSAKFLYKLLSTKGRNYSILKLFDTFDGMPESIESKDVHKAGDFVSNLELVKHELAKIQGENEIKFYKGFIPNTFQGLENDIISFAHIDVDIYQSVKDCSAFIYPRMVPGGFMVFDDYGEASCPGAREAVDEFFHDKPENPLVLETGQAVIFKN